jgi:Cdc6-like AAA superfamily ATPase
MQSRVFKEKFMVEKLMSMLERIDFGRLGAEADSLQDDPELFVTTRQSKAFHFPHHRIILGRKGAGKTALAQNFSSNYTSNYDFLLPIDADAIRFRN